MYHFSAHAATTVSLCVYIHTHTLFCQRMGVHNVNGKC